MMLHKAKTSKTYKWRLGIVGWAIFLYGFYFYYDGSIGYPEANKIRIRYAELEEQHAGDEIAKGQAWRQFMVEQGKWDADAISDPKPPGAVYAPADIQTQFILGTICCAIGGLILFFWFTSLGKWIGTDGQALVRGKLRVPFDDVTEMDTSRWRNKGIAVAHYTTDGQSGRFVIDDWKFDRPPADEIYKLLKNHLAQRDGQSADDAPDDAAKTAPEDAAATSN